MLQMTTQLLSQYEQELLQEIRHIPLPYLPNLLQIVRLFRDSVSQQQDSLKKEPAEDRSIGALDLLDEKNQPELHALLEIQAQYESKDRLREREPMRVNFDVIEFEDNFPRSRKESERVG